MLHQLARYVELEGITTEPGFAAKDVRWCIPCDATGRPTGELIDLATASNRRGRRFMKAPHLTQPELKRGGSGTRHFLADALEVIVELGSDGDPKITAKSVYFRGLLEQAAEALPKLGAIAAGLADPSAREALRVAAEAAKARPTDIATLALRDTNGTMVYPLERNEWHAWWRLFRATLQPPTRKGKNEPSSRMRCLATGELVTPVRTQPKVRGLASVGGIASGDALASFKQDAFRSYGLSQAENAAVSEEAAVLYTAALSRLVRNGRKLQNAVVAYWYDSETTPEIDPVAMIEGFDDEDERRAKLRAAARLLAAWQRGEPEARAIGTTPYYAYTLSGASGRVMVRDQLAGPFNELLAGIDTWFGELDIAHRDGSGRSAPPPKFFAVLGATVRDLKEVPAPFEAALWRAALRSEFPFPRDALARALYRARIDALEGETPRHARYGLIKAVINRTMRLRHSNHPKGDRYTVTTHLNEDHPSAAYQCGRAMAVLAALQNSALGDVGTGVIQRYYATASTSPALVVGRLVRNAQFHLNKLDPGLRHWYEEKLGTVLSRIEGQLPTNLNLEQQGLFALGYYQQQAHNRSKKRHEQTAGVASGEE